MRTGILSDQIRQLPTSLFIGRFFRSKGWRIFQSSIIVEKFWIGRNGGVENAENVEIRKISTENSEVLFRKIRIETLGIYFGIIYWWYSRDTWKIVVVWKNFWIEGVVEGSRILERFRRVDLKTSKNPSNFYPHLHRHLPTLRIRNLYISFQRERERESMIQGNPEITSCEDKSIHGSINPFSKKRKKKRGLTKRVQKNGHPSSRQGDAVLEHLGLACVRGYNGSTGHGEVSGCCPNGWEAYIGGGPRIGHSVVRGLIGRGIRWIS